MKKYNSTNDKFGYNIKKGGQNKSHSEETKRKIGEANKIALKGNKWSEQQKTINFTNVFRRRKSFLWKTSYRRAKN